MHKTKHNSSSGVAIIGMACIFPKAPDLNTYWNNILDKVDAVGKPIPEWEGERYLDPNRPDNDSIYTDAGGFLGDLYAFDPTEFGIMPNSLDGGEPDQFLALKVAADALRDGGYLRDDYDHTNTGIILGHSTYLHRGQANAIQHGVVLDQTVELLAQLFPNLDAAQRRDIRAMLSSHLPTFNADVSPGLVPNVMTGRIANRLDLMGPNYIIDAACASSSLAVEACMDELLEQRSDLMLAGGVNASLPPEVAVIFSHIGALSRREKVRPFSTGTDGTLLGEGLGVVLMKRLDDALRDGDRIYSVVRSVGHSSDGRAQGLLAPRMEGELTALKRAYQRSGIDPMDIGLIEAHGTGIPLGDRTEMTALTQLFGERQGEMPRIGLGSVKSMISHTIPASGIAGLIKTSLALHHKILPPTICEEVNSELEIDKTPFYINGELRPWLHRADRPRRAGVNSFGFGGINTHVILEEPPAAAPLHPMAARRWECELFLFAAQTAQALQAQLQQLQVCIADGAEYTLADLAYTQQQQLHSGHCRLAVIASDLVDLNKKLATALKRLASGKNGQWATRTGLYYCDTPLSGKLAMMFTGEGGQYSGMLKDLAFHFPVVREWLDLWESLCKEERDLLPSDLLYPPALGLSEAQRDALEQRLHDMDFGSEAVFFSSQALFALLESLGLKADAMVGHSTGESSALAASRAMPFTQLSEVGDHVRRLNKVYQEIEKSEGVPSGVLLTIGALGEAEVNALCESFSDQVHVAMDNCVNQVVLFGEQTVLDELEKQAVEQGAICAKLPFDRAYHTPLFSGVAGAFRSFYDDIDLQAPTLPLYSCASAACFPDDTAGVRELATAQWIGTVRFRETVEKMYDDGMRFFVEVGPSGNLTSFVDDVLKGRPYLVQASNVRHRSGLSQLLHLLGQLFVQGRDELNYQQLFADRGVQTLDLDAKAQPKSRTTPLLNTLPYIRLDEKQCSDLREMLLQGVEQRGDPLSSPSASPLQPLPPFESSAKGSAVSAAEQSEVMQNYLGMMRQFLTTQQQVMTMGTGLVEAASPWPFIDELLLHEAGHVQFQCRLCRADERFLQHHILCGQVSAVDPDWQGLSVAPLTVSLEIMAEAAALLAGEAMSLHVIENIQAANWIALDHDQIVLLVEAQLITGNRYAVTITSDDKSYIKAEYCFAETPLTTVEPVEPLNGELHASRWKDEELYALGMFHGPIFQSIGHLRCWNQHGVEADLAATTLDGFFIAGQRPAFVINPVVLDGVGQLSAYWISEQQGTDFNCFPSSIRRIEFAQPLPDEQADLILRGRLRAEELNDRGERRFMEWDYDCVDGNGLPQFRVYGWRDRYFSVPHRFYQARKTPQQAWFGEPLTLLQQSLPEVTLWWLPPLPPSLLEDAGAIFKRLLSRSMLSPAEHQQWWALSSNPHRRSEWLLGRMMLKEVTRYLIHQTYGEVLFPADLEVVTDRAGKPYVSGSWQQTMPLPVEVSLAHSKGYTLAAGRADGHPVGVDMEFYGRVAEPELIVHSFTPDEQQTLHGVSGREYEQRMLSIWCAKEAAAKLLGLGLNGQPENFQVILDLKSMKSASVSYGDRVLHVALESIDNGLIAVAVDPSQQSSLNH